MGQEEKQGEPFRFLTEVEFKALDNQRKAHYLVRAQQELEEQQRVLRLQAWQLATKAR